MTGVNVNTAKEESSKQATDNECMSTHHGVTVFPPFSLLH